MAAELSERIAREFRQKIERGEWIAGVRLPTTRQLAATYQVSVNTIQHAFRELEADDLVDRRPRLGGFVKTRPTQINGRKNANTFGVIGPYSDVVYATEGTSDSWGYRIIRGCDQTLTPMGFHISMLSYDPEDIEAQTKLLKKVDETGANLGGVLCFLAPPIASLPEELDKRDIPWVTVNRTGDYTAQNFVAHDAFRAARLIACCFARMNYQRIVILSDPLGMVGRSTNDKYFGFMEGWIESGKQARNVDFLRVSGNGDSDGYRAIHAYIQEYGPPSGIFAAGDLLALGAMHACDDLGVNVPAQTAIIGATGLQLAAYSRPSLTVLDTPMEQLGAEAATMLLDMAREGLRRVNGRYVPARLVIRDSCPIPQDILDDAGALADSYIRQQRQSISQT